MYGATQAAATPEDLNIPYPPAAPFGGHRKEEPESELSHHRNQTPQQQQQQMSSGLARFRSAPSSFLGELCEELIPARPSETENMFARFLAPPDLQDNPPHGATVDCQRRHQFRPPPPPPDEMVSSHHKAALSSTPPMMYRHSQQRLHMPNHKLTDSSQQAVGSMAMEADGIENGGGRSSSDLTRQSSSPVGLFSNLNVDNGYAMMRGMGGFRNGDLPPMGDASSRLKGQLSFASTQNSLMSQISETGSKEINPGSHGESSHAGRSYIPGVSMTCWEETYLLPPSNFSGMKRSREDEGKIMNQSQSQNGEMRGHVSCLTHQLSLPKSSSEMAAIEKFLQFQDAVPCRTRAKRGCATHPRSIAERVRRTKISERMRKLQELVPNMDKQTNTADMLDLAVDYINDLQKQVKTLAEGRATCTCLSSKQKSYLSSGVRDC